MTSTRRTLLEAAYLLHHRPWSDTSRILDFMTRNHGRVTLFAHGARRPKSPLRAVLRPFVPVLVSWSGRADGGTLTLNEPSFITGATFVNGGELDLNKTPSFYAIGGNLTIGDGTGTDRRPSDAVDSVDARASRASR